MREGSKVYYKEHDPHKQSRDIWTVNEVMNDGLVVIFRDKLVQKKGVSKTVRETKLELMDALEVFKL